MNPMVNDLWLARERVASRQHWGWSATILYGFHFDRVATTQFANIGQTAVLGLLSVGLFISVVLLFISSRTVRSTVPYKGSVFRLASF